MFKSAQIFLKISKCVTVFYAELVAKLGNEASEENGLYLESLRWNSP